MSLAVPPGDPEGVRAASRALVRAAGAWEAAASRTSSTARAVMAEWHGPSARSLAARTGETTGGLRVLGEAYARAGRALDDYAEALDDAQQRARAAQAALREAGQEHAHAVRTAAAAACLPAVGRSEEAAARATRTAQAAQRWAIAEADSALRVARAQAERQAEQAQEDVDTAARRCTWHLQEAADALRGTTLADLLDWLGGPDTAFGLLGLFDQGLSAKSLHAARKALLAGDVGKLADMDPDGYRQVLQVAAQHGDDSLEALSAQVRWQSGVVPRLVARMSESAVPLNSLPTGQTAAALDLLAKAGVVTSVVSNVWTVLGPDPDGKSTGLDKGMAVANTVGLGLVATGSATAMGLVGLSATTGWVPVAGQVVLAVTAAYLAYDWYRDNREMVHDLVERVDAGFARAGQWAQQELRDYADEVRRELDTARDTVVGVAQDGVELARDARDRGEELLDEAGVLAGQARERGEELLDDAGELTDRARDRAAGAVSAVNPFD